MEKTKKIAIAVASIAAAGALVTAGAFAFFSDSATSSSKATIGGVEIAPTQIMVGNASATRNIDSEFISTYTYYRYDGSNYDTPSTSGYWSEHNTGYTPRWKYRAEGAGVEINYFRTSDGEVSYCMDLGKSGPSSGAANEETLVSEMANRILEAGYPNKTAANYQSQYPGLTDIELEWATQVALKIAEGSCYVSDGSGGLVNDPSRALKLSDFDINGGESSRIVPMSMSRTDEAARAFNVLSMLVNKASGTSVSSYYRMNTDSVAIEKRDDGYSVGPYVVTTNVTGTITFTADSAGVSFFDANNTTDITASGIPASSDGSEKTVSFYVHVPNSATEQVNFNAQIAGKTMPASYYYWTGSDDEQKMLVAKTVPVSSENSITTTFYTEMDTWNPGDISTFRWEVENVQNKSIDTRNTIYMYWEGVDMDKAPVYLYTDATDNMAIYNDIKSGNPKSNVDMGNLSTFVINGVQRTGYMLTVNGDTLDGVGNDAETGDAKEVNYGSHADDTLTTKDILAYKVALSPYASYESMKKNFKIVVVTEAKQYRNTQDASSGGWSVVDTAEVNF